LLLGDDCDIRQNHRFSGIAHTWVQLPAFFAGVQRYKHFLNKQKNLQGVPSKTPPGTLSPKKRARCPVPDPTWYTFAQKTPAAWTDSRSSFNLYILIRIATRKRSLQQGSLKQIPSTRLPLNRSLQQGFLKQGFLKQIYSTMLP